MWHLKAKYHSLVKNKLAIAEFVNQFKKDIAKINELENEESVEGILGIYDMAKRISQSFTIEKKKPAADPPV